MATAKPIADVFLAVLHCLLALSACLALTVGVTWTLAESQLLRGAWLFVGIWQLVYVIPAVVWLKRGGRRAAMGGVLIAAGLGLLFSVLLVGGGLLGFISA